jgi:hypothetical protein
MGAVGQVDAGSVNESDVRLVHQFGRVEGVLKRRAPQPPVSQLAQPIV